VEAQGKQHPRKTSRARLVGSVVLLGLSGCATWDDLTSREFSFKTYFAKQDPLVVLRDSRDGDHRQKALRQLKEPLQNGGTQVEQDAVVKILLTAALYEKQPICRLAAIQTMGNFKDPRVIPALLDAYYKGNPDSPEMAKELKCAALTSMGQTGNPEVVETLVLALREPPADGPESERQFKMDERIAAARALGHFNHYKATQALVEVLRKENKNPALRDRANESLQLATGQDLPADAQAWADYFSKPSQGPPRDEWAGKKFLTAITPTSWWK
jgi:hypothetical protein